MSRSDRRRMHAHILAMAALILVAAATLAMSLANARSTSAAVRAALLPTLAALGQAETPGSPEVLPGSVAPDPPVAAAIEQAAMAYLTAIDASEWETAWALTHPDTRGGIEMDGWALPTIAEREGSGVEDDWEHGVERALPTLMMGAETEIGRIVTEEMSGWAELTVRTQFPGTLLMRRKGDGWALDLEETRQTEAREAISRQLQAYTGGQSDPYDFFRAMMMAEGAGVAGYSLTDLALSPQIEAEFHVESVSVADDRAVVRVTGVSILRVAMPLANGDRGWSMAWCRDPVLLGPEISFEDVIAGQRSGAAAANVCRANLRQLALAVLMYCQDYDERFPPADRWCSVTYPYTRNREIHHCPEDDTPFSYAFNYKLSRQTLSAVERPAETIGLYESEIGKGDAFDWPDYPGSSIPDPARHRGGNYYAFIDGHVSLLSSDDSRVQEDAYRLSLRE
ncbi:MAG: hypothetical protein GX131_06425 [candidate division WS1 bacterium]|nr:hypothetical protein [candidate division WS1 bacterium]